MNMAKPLKSVAMTVLEENEFCQIVCWPKTARSAGGYGVFDRKDPEPHRTRSLAHARKVFYRWTTRLKREAVHRRQP